MARDIISQASGVGGAEATLKVLDYIEDEALVIQHSIWRNRPVRAVRQLKKLSKETDFLEEQVLGLYRALTALERSLEELEEMSEGDHTAWDLTNLGLQFLREGNWGAASDTVERAVAALGPEGLGRSLSTLNRHLNELGELSDTEDIALTLVRQGRKSLGKDDLQSAAESFEKAITALGPVAVTEAASPFLVNNFFLSIGTKWPEGHGYGLMVVTLENLGDNNIAPMRMDPPVPFGWSATPRMTEIPEIPPEGFIEIGIEIRPSGAFPQTALLGTSISVTTGYLVNYGDVEVQIRVENRTPKAMEGLLLDPWMPEGFETMRLPLVENLGPGDVVHVPVEVLNVNKSVGISA
ncbi:MAG: hypothetical protein QF760_02045 [Candidatus Thalassarchaeaceae archaeon]|jgi:hypothetical protein|nr:hypothetical protein [Candidatus Thalassarchaeaceae archaeon]MDP6703290.1 hypothetical protein [Candidatus Thalassarchaeaceae archaeon]MDP7004061.1 hypothetical protein [Candidatus Thalassarchaeaceae archaeon]